MDTPKNTSGRVILVVEDDAQVRPVIAETLQSEGFEVVAAASTREALEVLEDSDRKIDLLLTDIAMPERLNGFGLAQRAKQLRPDLSIIYASGYLQGAPLQELGIGYGPILHKPFRGEELIAEVNRALSSAAAA